MTGTQVLRLQTRTSGAVPAQVRDLAVERVRGLLRLAPEPVLYGRVKLTMLADPAVARPAIAQVNIDLNGRLVRAQATGETLRDAIGQMCDRLRVRLTRASRTWAATRGGQPEAAPHEWRHQSAPAPRPPYFPRPPQQRQVVRHKSYALARQAPAEAIADLEALDFDFYLFTDAASGQDAVAYRAGEGYRIAFAQPQPGSPAQVGEAITVSERPAPRLSLTDAITRLEALPQPFLFFVDTSTGRGGIIYHRYDGHYGVITPVAR